MKLNFKNKNHKIISALFGVFIFVFVFLLSQVDISKTVAQTSTPKLSGYAWSDNIGWISMSGTGYGVSIDSDKKLIGYAWSDNIGWIKFGELTDFPTGSGTTAENAKYNINNKLTGWAKALSADNNGWDGWISLSGTGYEVKLNSSQSSDQSWAWGSDVVGWIDFSGVTSQSSVVDGVCRTYLGVAPQLPVLPGIADLCISGTASTPTEQRIAHTPTDNENPYDYVYTWDCNGNGGTNASGCSVTANLQRSSGSGPVPISARLKPSIVNTGGKCVVSIVESSEVLNEINASSTCAVYNSSDSTLTSPVSAGNPASSNSIERPNVDPGYDYKVVCKDNANTQTFISKTLKCLLNPKVKEI